MKCKWCNKEAEKEYCSFECRKAFFDHYDEEDKYKSRRKPMLIASVLVSIPFMILFVGAGISVMFLLLGLTVYNHPFPSAELKKKMSLKSAVNRVKIKGIILILIGLPFLALTSTPFI